MRFHIPIKLPSLLNIRTHWAKLTKAQQKSITAAVMHNAVQDEPIPIIPLLITITRLGPRRLDDDNLTAACKYVRDQIATKVGVDDGSDQYTWIYKQELSKTYGVDVEIISR